MVLENDEKECPYCAEVIKMKAVFCNMGSLFVQKNTRTVCCLSE